MVGVQRAMKKTVSKLKQITSVGQKLPKLFRYFRCFSYILLVKLFTNWRAQVTICLFISWFLSRFFSCITTIFTFYFHTLTFILLSTYIWVRCKFKFLASLVSSISTVKGYDAASLFPNQTESWVNTQLAYVPVRFGTNSTYTSHPVSFKPCFLSVQTESWAQLALSLSGKGHGLRNGDTCCGSSARPH